MLSSDDDVFWNSGNVLFRHLLFFDGHPPTTTATDFPKEYTRIERDVGEVAILGNGTGEDATKEHTFIA